MVGKMQRFVGGSSTDFYMLDNFDTAQPTISPLTDDEFLEFNQNGSDFIAKHDWLSTYYQSINPFDFYRDIFPEGSFERLGHQEDKKGNGIAVVISAKKGVEDKQGSLRVVTDGLEQLEELLNNDFVVMSPISYYGRSRKAQNALWLHALTLDIDYVNAACLRSLFTQIDMDLIPLPTYVVNSGHGVHLYYVFEHPIPMYRENQQELKKLKMALIDRAWNKYTSNNLEAKEALGIVQGFRMVGSKSKLGPAATVEAFLTGEKVTVEYLNGYLLKEEKINIEQRKERIPLDKAKELYPDWYEKRIVEGKSAGRWYVKRDLYDWFKRQILVKASVGHRYFCMMCLAIYAAKCDINYDELLKDACELQPEFNSLGKGQGKPFTLDETMKALETYNESYIRFPRETMERISGVPMPANKRNGRKQKLHLRIARSNLEILNEESGTTLQGRPIGSGTKADLVRKYAAEHPEKNHSQIAKALGVSRPTVIKWLKHQKKDS